MDKYEKRRLALMALRKSLGAGAVNRIAEAIDRDATYISRMLAPPEKAGRKRITEDFVELLDAAFPGWLPREEITGTTDTSYAVNVEPTDAERQQYPLISWVQAGVWREIVDAYPRGWGESMVFAQNQHGGLTFALKVMGDSMEPEFREGDVIFVDPDKKPKAGSYVVAKNHEEEATFKKYRSRGKDAEGREVFELMPLNENYATLRSDQQPITIIGVVVEHTRVFKV